MEPLIFKDSLALKIMFDNFKDYFTDIKPYNSNKAQKHQITVTMHGVIINISLNFTKSKETGISKISSYNFYFSNPQTNQNLHSVTQLVGKKTPEKMASVLFNLVYTKSLECQTVVQEQNGQAENYKHLNDFLKEYDKDFTTNIHIRPRMNGKEARIEFYFPLRVLSKETGEELIKELIELSQKYKK